MDPFAAFGMGPSAPGPSPMNAGAPAKQGRALFDYSAAAPNQISLKRGQTVRILSVGAAGGWSKGEEIGTGKLQAQDSQRFIVGCSNPPLVLTIPLPAWLPHSLPSRRQNRLLPQ